jgi:hypothetical protein
MTAADVWAQAKQRLTQNLGSFVAGAVLFVDDGRVTYDLPDRISVERADLFGIDDVGAWEPFLTPRPTWLHFNLLPVDRGLSVVTLRRSRNAIAPEDPRATSVNVSVEQVDAEVGGA